MLRLIVILNLGIWTQCVADYKTAFPIKSVQTPPCLAASEPSLWDLYTLLLDFSESSCVLELTLELK